VQDAIAAIVERRLAHIHGRAFTAGVTLTGPAPCAIDRIRGRWRWHFLLRSRSAPVLGAICRELQRFELRPGRAGLRMILDRDPVSLL
jgi:primosomal protein N' (replication factor Y) (superfamily II helicase)